MRVSPSCTCHSMLTWPPSCLNTSSAHNWPQNTPASRVKPNRVMILAGA
ncbi:Uncharacterised protein [Vibrio cholerae]|nr:Uncharacterised protein [Vibrio cholerae]